jgi:15-cis-phytoene synthase
MVGAPVGLDEAYARCREIARREARNFYYGFVMLPPERRAGIYAAYAFSRRCDDSVDGDDDVDAKLAALRARRAELEACYAGTAPPDDPVLVALADAVRRFGIPRVHLADLIDGVEMDLTVTRYRDFAHLRRYCDRVAGAVGLVSLHIFGFSSPRAPGHAEDLGVALQIVNIMRDVAEDAARNRIYLPADEMAAHGVPEADVLAGAYSGRFRELMRQQGARAHEYLERGSRLLPLLDRRARMCVAMLAGLYREILEDIEAGDYDVFTSRVSLSTPRKLVLMGGETLATLTGRSR